MYTKRKTPSETFFCVHECVPINGILALVVFVSCDQTTGVVTLNTVLTTRLWVFPIGPYTENRATYFFDGWRWENVKAQIRFYLKLWSIPDEHGKHKRSPKTICIWLNRMTSLLKWKVCYNRNLEKRRSKNIRFAQQCVLNKWKFRVRKRNQFGTPHSARNCVHN